MARDTGMAKLRPQGSSMAEGIDRSAHMSTSHEYEPCKMSALEMDTEDLCDDHNHNHYDDDEYHDLRGEGQVASSSLFRMMMPLVLGSRDDEEDDGGQIRQRITMTEIAANSRASYPLYAAAAGLTLLLLAAIIWIPATDQTMTNTTFNISNPADINETIYNNTRAPLNLNHKQDVQLTCSMEEESWFELYQMNHDKNHSGSCISAIAPTQCHCHNPFVAARASRTSSWGLVAQRNGALVNQSFFPEHPYPAVDVVFLGDSITEQWMGTQLGHVQTALEPIRHIFQKFFNQSNSSFHGLALGIGGDRIPDLQYRIQILHELGAIAQTRQGNPPIFWILIGTNDYGGDRCNAESIAAGNIAIAQEIQHQMPRATVVINSQLPRQSPGQQNLGRDGEVNAAWPVLSRSNQLLACAIDQQQQSRAPDSGRIYFFNVTSLFLDTTNPSSANATMLRDGLHPSVTGHDVWAQAIQAQLQYLMPGKGTRK